MPYRLDIPGQVSEAQLRAIEAVATLVPERGCVIEVGSLFGRSSWAWSHSVPETATVVCVDPWTGNEGAYQVGEASGDLYGFDAFARYTEDCPNIIPMRAFSPQGVSWNRKIDCYYEDAVHQDPVLSQNIEFWSKHLRPTGILCGDDYRPRFPDVRSAAERMSRELGRELLIVDFFWCLLPDAKLVPAAANVAERLREIGREAAAERDALPSAIHLTPLTPLPDRVATGREYRFVLRVTNDGGMPWPKQPSADLGLQVKILGGAAGRTRTSIIPLGYDQITPDLAVPYTLTLTPEDLKGAVVDVEGAIVGVPGSEPVAGWKHRFLVDGAGGVPVASVKEEVPIEFCEGWWEKEEFFRWSVGFKSEIKIDISDIEKEYFYINMDLRPYISKIHNSQNIYVLIDGIVIFSTKFSDKLYLSIPCKRKEFKDIIYIKFIHPDAHRPMDALNSNNDSRSLAFAMEDIYILT